MFEAGVKYSSSIAAFSGAYFYGLLYDFIFHRIENGQVIVSFRIPDSTVWGFEFEFLSRPTEKLELHGTATFVKVDLPEINQTGIFYDGFTPAVIDFDASYLIYRNTHIMFDWHRVGERFSNSALTDRLPDYNYFNLGASYRFPDAGFTIEARVLNLTQSKGLEEANPLFIRFQVDDHICFLPGRFCRGELLSKQNTIFKIRFNPCSSPGSRRRRYR